jgi:hypothetical protein
MRASTVRPVVVWVIAIAAAACSGDRKQTAETAGDSTAATVSASPPAPAANPANATSSTPQPKPANPRIVDSHASVPECRRPVPVTYYARGGVPDEFIVTFGAMNGAPADAVIDSLARRHGFTATHRYQGAFSGFSARLPIATLTAIRCEPAVTRISQVVVGNIGATPPPHVDD